MVDRDAHNEGPAHVAAVGRDAAADAEEASGRRLMGVQAGSMVALGLVAGVAGGPVGRHVGLPGWLVRLAGASTVAAGMGVGVASVAEDWRAPLRVVLTGNGVAGAALLGHAAFRGTVPGRVAVLGLAAACGAGAYRQARALVEAQGPVVA